MDWWTDLDQTVIRCLAGNGAMTPEEIGREMGMSEAAVSSLVSGLAREGKVRIRLVELAPGVSID